jgi:outer membrane translocation and assembly module TamA
MFDQSLFYPLYKNEENPHRSVVTALRLRWGHIFRQNFEEIMPIERFFLGGPYSVRGYSKDTVPPLGQTTKLVDGKTVTEYTIQGGSSMLNGNIELRFPIYKSFGGVVFQDIGVLSQSGFSGFTSRWYPASGYGLRYHTPIGALRFDMGWKWKKSFPGDSSYAWYLTLSQIF